MAGFKVTGPRVVLAIALLGGATLLAVTLKPRHSLVSADAASAQGEQSEKAALEPAGPTAAPAPEAKPVERRSDQPMKIDPAALRVKRVLKIDGPFRHGDYAWDEKGAPATGPVIITVDLRAQTLSVFRDGYEIGAAVILYGATDKPSPLGAFPITQKDADHVSNLYDAPMPYAQRLTSDGVFIHGSNVQYGRGTHGCIGVPVAFAKKLFGVTKIGDIAVITDGKMLDVSKATVEG